MEGSSFIHKKFLGQCFLRDKRAIGIIGRHLEKNIEKGAVIVEIGPGMGVLTRVLLDLRPQKLFLVDHKNHLLYL